MEVVEGQRALGMLTEELKLPKGQKDKYQDYYKPKSVEWR
jgi:hypothetical protein